MPSTARLGLVAAELLIHEEGEQRIWLKSSGKRGQPLRDAANLVVRGEGYATHDEAALEGERWRDVISRSFARMHLAADFRDQDPMSSSITTAEPVFSEHLGRHVMEGVAGVTVFQDQSDLLLITAGDVFGCVRPSEEKCRSVFLHAVQLHEPLKVAERLAFDLYSGSFFQTSAAARLLMLTMAVETLLNLQPRSTAAQAHVTAMIKATEANADLTRDERASLLGTLSWLHDESISQAGRRLARTLEPRKYGGRKPAAFFTRCYEVRSALTHGRVPRPDHREVNSLAGSLEPFVGDLLAGRLLTEAPD
ncbi:hypothetical protein [Streptomyces pseudovenezuelae]|uniref:hypothetical protein n=1 Tax=Streptomyces pseudovenezuelae TaxID=67350 RepID=UPI002E31C779|nr:hypothetical protein [Streptomyces pseudovenezuelae]